MSDLEPGWWEADRVGLGADLFIQSGPGTFLEKLEADVEVPLRRGQGGPVIGTATLHRDGTVTGVVHDPKGTLTANYAMQHGFSVSTDAVVLNGSDDEPSNPA